MGQQALAVVVDSDLTRCDVCIDRLFAFLPVLRPEPRLIRRDRQLRAQFKHAIAADGGLELSAGLIEMQALAKLGRQRDHSAPLDPEKAVPDNVHAHSVTAQQ